MQATHLEFQQAQQLRIQNRWRALKSCIHTLIATMCMGAVANAQSPETSVSGTYLSRSADAVELVQIIVTPNGGLAGRMESAQITESGGIETTSTPIEGAANGEHVTFTTKSILLGLIAAPNFSGTVSGGTLDLSWQGGRRLFQRGDADQFQIAISQLQLRSASILRANAAAQAAGQFQELKVIADRLDQNLPSVRAQLASAANAYRVMFDRMHNRRRAQAIHSGIPDQNLAASRAGLDAQSAARDIEEVRRETVNFRRQIDNEFDRSERLNRSLASFCGSAAAAEPASPCADTASQANRIFELKAAYAEAFAVLDSAYEEASVDVPPGRRLLENLLQ